MTAPLRVAIVGPGRSRNGLGPFFARWFAHHGARVVAGCGRDAERTRAANAAIEADLGQPVADHVDVRRMLDVERPDAVVIACPVGGHLDALRAAADAGVHTLCEKPLVREAETDAVDGLLDAFAARERVFVENCQWPETLGAFDAVWPGSLADPVRRVRMRLSPTGRGRAMVEDSLSHALSVAQAVAPIDRTTRAVDVRIADRSAGSEHTSVTARLSGDAAEVELVLELEHVPRQPRPASVELDGRRLDRHVDTSGGGYRIGFLDPAGNHVPIDDPLSRLVYRFALLTREAHGDGIRDQSERARERARLYRDVLAHW